MQPDNQAQNERQKLVEQSLALQAQEREISKQIAAIDHNEKMAKAQQYLGKCFRRNSDYGGDNIYMESIYVYDVNESCQLESLVCGYWINNNVGFECDYYGQFDPEGYDDDRDYTPITRDEFDEHYAQVMKRIKLVMEKGK